MSSTVIFNNKSSTNDNTKHLEIFSLIWLNDSYNIEDSLDAQQKLRVIINFFKEFQDAKECQEYIAERSKQDRLILIVNDQLGKEIIPSIHKLPQVLSIYIYRQDKKSNEQWNNKFPKVKAIVLEIDELVSRIKADLTRHMKEDEPLSMNMLGTGKSTTAINGHFVFSQVFFDCLLRLRSTGEDRNELISCLRNEYKGNTCMLNKICEFENNYTSNKAFWWYTFDSFVYRTLNAALRKEDIHMILLYSSFISDIHRQLQYHHQQLKCPVRVYRFQLMLIDELRYLGQYIGQFISMNSFLSTSMERSVAIFYMGDQTHPSDLERVLFEIEANPKVVTTKPFADISMHSCLDQESEVLFMLGSIFRLNKITLGDDQVWVIEMTLCNDDEHDLKQVLADMKKQTGIGETNFHTLGKVLWNMGKLDLAEKYYNRLIGELSSNDPLLNILYEELSRIASQQGNYDKSVQLRSKSCEIRNQLPPTDIINKVKQTLQVEPSIDIDPIITRERIYQTVTTLKETVEQVKANKNQCKRLGERVDRIISVLRCINGKDLQKVELRKSLMDFCICLELCLAFVTKFQVDKLWFLKIFNGINSKDQFEKMNTQLLQCVTDLNLGINLQQIFDPQQDKLDQQNDLNAIQDKLDEIASMMVQQQQEQLHYVQNIEKDVRPRHNSYKHHLQQSIIQANDLTKEKKLSDREHTFRCIPYYDLIQEERIGQGGFADVYRGRWLSQDHEVAIKIIRITSLDERVEEDFIKEISTMQRIRYEHVLNIYGACMEPTKYALVVEYMSLGSLHDVLRQKTIQLTWSDRWMIARQMTKGLHYLHTLSEPIIHRDIKSHNILMTKNSQGFLVKIGDLGLAKIRHETSQYFTHRPIVGTLSWKAPELLGMGKHTEASDVYALGMVFWELATEYEPYKDADDGAISQFVRSGGRLPIPALVPERYTQLITNAWAQDPGQRPTCQQLLCLLKEKYSEPDTVNEIKEKVDNSQAPKPSRNRVTNSLLRQHSFRSTDEQFETSNFSYLLSTKDKCLPIKTVQSKRHHSSTPRCKKTTCKSFKGEVMAFASDRSDDDSIADMLRSNRTIQQSTYSLISQFCDLQRRFARDVASVYQHLSTIKGVVNIFPDANTTALLQQYKPAEKIELVVCGAKSSGKSSLIQQLLGYDSLLPIGIGNVPQRNVKFSHASADHACLLIHEKNRYSRSLATRINLPSPQVHKIIQSHLLCGEETIASDDWASSLVEICIPSPLLQLNMDIYEITGATEITNIHVKQPCFLFLYEGFTPSDEAQKYYEQLRLSIGNTIHGQIFYLNTKVGLDNDRHRRYEHLRNTLSIDNPHPRPLAECDRFDLFNIEPVEHPTTRTTRLTALNRILRFAFEHALRKTQQVSNLMLDAIDGFFDFVLITNRRSTREWNDIRDEALRWTNEFFRQYRLQVDTLGGEAQQQLLSRFHQQREQLTNKMLSYRKQRHEELKLQISGLTLINAVHPIQISGEKNFLRLLIRDEIVRPVLGDIFDQIRHRVSAQIDRNLCGRRTTRNNELIRTAYGEFLNHISMIDDNRQREYVKKLSLKEILIGISGLISTLGTVFSLTELEVNDVVNDDLGGIEQSFATIGRRIKRSVCEGLEANEIFFREKIHAYHRIVLATMDRRQQAYRLARTFAAEFARIECLLLANTDFIQHYGATPTIELGTTLDRGGFFSIHLASWGSERDLVAKVLLPSSRLAAIAYMEAHFHRAITRFHIDHIVPLRFLYHDSRTDRLYILLPRYPMSLHTYLTEHMADLTMNEAVRFVLHISRAIAHMYAHSLTHRDIKAQNILLDNDRNVFLADFGTCQHGTENMTIIGSRPRPPELDHADERANFSYEGTAVDMFSLGILMYDVAPKAVYYQSLQTVSAAEIQALTHVPERYRALITDCTHPDAKLRPTASRVAEQLQTIAEQVNNAKECLLCFEHPVFSRCLPCGHKTICGKCLSDLRQRATARDPPQCILCRQVITSAQEDIDNSTYTEI